ncbi:hypothetical protein [Micromonospora craniellae]|uniref:AraC family transcriptional regulator n=1 Tax=Micromonospora craniellae TaxID=2294034 RepID=A0A372FX10_9ACTN|nr:hypothetical protein [Micromonospora craniellae]QOC94175.1 hypothetical protein ID554_11540 [Micromonospora craniellae]RFS45076.1 hypothetical protein D0Q02_18805 [Micromonospora craniellae]
MVELTGRRRSFADLADHWPPAAAPSPAICAGTDAARCRALNDLLTGWKPRPTPVTDEVMRLAEAIRTDRNVRRVDGFARDNGLSVRRLQRLFLSQIDAGSRAAPCTATLTASPLPRPRLAIESWCETTAP